MKETRTKLWCYTLLHAEKTQMLMAIFNDDYSEIDVELLLFNNIVVGKLNKTNWFCRANEDFCVDFSLGKCMNSTSKCLKYVRFVGRSQTHWNKMCKTIEMFEEIQSTSIERKKRTKVIFQRIRSLSRFNVSLTHMREKDDRARTKGNGIG